MTRQLYYLSLLAPGFEWGEVLERDESTRGLVYEGSPGAIKRCLILRVFDGKTVEVRCTTDSRDRLQQEWFQ